MINNNNQCIVILCTNIQYIRKTGINTLLECSISTTPASFYVYEVDCASGNLGLSEIRFAVYKAMKSIVREASLFLQ